MLREIARLVVDINTQKKSEKGGFRRGFLETRNYRGSQSRIHRQGAKSAKEDWALYFSNGSRSYRRSTIGKIEINEKLKRPSSHRLLKKVQMQGGARCEVRDVLSPYVAAPRERGGTRRRRVSADGPFSAAC